jgi:nucleoside-diphosphate-sugar epimerase
MSENPAAPLVAITGAHGWLGRCLRCYFEAHGWRVRALVRTPRDETERSFQLGRPVSTETLAGVSALVHCAYDFQPVTWPELERINVLGSGQLFDAAREAGVRRLVHISTMSAFAGCRSLYGRAKLATEKLAAPHGALILRPGLITGAEAGGMYGRLVQQVRGGRFLPLIAGEAELYAIHEADLSALIYRFCSGQITAPAGPVTAAHPQPWPFRALLAEISRREGRSPTFLPVPWRAVWLALRSAEALGLRLNFRSDSVLSLANQDPHPDFSTHAALGFQPRPFAAA